MIEERRKFIRIDAGIDFTYRLKGAKGAMGKVIWTADEKAGKINAGIKFEEIDAEMKNRFLEHVCELMFSQLERLKV